MGSTTQMPPPVVDAFVFLQLEGSDLPPRLDDRQQRRKMSSRMHRSTAKSRRRNAGLVPKERFETSRRLGLTSVSHRITSRESLSQQKGLFSVL